MITFKSADFWLEAWQEGKKDALNALRDEVHTDGHYWDQRAKGFAKLGKTDEIEERAKKLAEILAARGRASKDMHLLDIGSGTGNYVIPLAHKLGQVMALDPSGEMLRLLRERADAEGLDNIDTGQLYWEKVDLAAKGWEQGFDVVMATMSPGISEVATLKKMIDASRGSCLLVGHLSREDTGRQELWGRLLGSEMRPVCPDIFYIFHLLYSWGYRPMLDTEEKVIVRYLGPEEIIEVYKTHFYPYLNMTKAMEGKIADYVREKTMDGRYREERRFTIGYLCWDV
ncbi:class I SAM-dependent methyltransferase [Metallumcola ferriviriculae]|uniref:Class I SAM-dependent methyltransferase n=1 Tax=Metallumcola ferriviriculae TaxID=3039180 RepID=A0AAU0UMU6_9FIRM|nr:class I SAM-dependent methyltransferase [Desulfitibacteraceae bacterium MK1]